MITKKRSPRKRRSKKPESEQAIIPLVPGEFVNRELSWLEFNKRVLAEAKDERNPLLERVRFLTIFTSNLDEFFMNRVGGLKQRISAGFASPSPDGLSAHNQLEAIRTVVVSLLQEQASCYFSVLKPELEKQHIHILAWEQLNEAEKLQATQYYQTNVFPILTPQAVDPGHPFPFISNLSVSLGVLLSHPDRDEQLFARVKVPSVLPRFVRLEASSPSIEFRFISLANIIAQHVSSLFPGMVVQSIMPFRVTRNAEIDVDDYEVEDLVEVIEEELRERRFAKVVRLELGPNPHPLIRRFLLEEMELSDFDVYELPVDFDYLSIREIADLNIARLKYEAWSPLTPPVLMDEDANILSLIRSGDILVHHPYESFSSSVERFLRAAVEDPKVLAIKMTLYRAGDKSSLVPLLIRAAELEKHVVCLIELKAHFDEARNIHLAQSLEDAGVHVMYGVLGLKTHAKVILVARQEPDGIRCYSHIGTGNYNPTTARVYTDLGLFTANPEICEDLVELFNYLTGRSLKREYKQLIISPHNMKERILKMIDREILNHQAGKPAHIVAKMNSLEDVVVCRALTKAAQAGVPVDLIVRGLCVLKAAGPGTKEHLRVVSVIGRFLEHSRLVYFRNAGAAPLDGEFYLGSADLMYRNLHRRVEVLTPIIERTLKERCWEILSLCLADRRQVWELLPSGHYERLAPTNEKDSNGVQQQLMRTTKDRIKQAYGAMHEGMMSLGDGQSEAERELT